MAFATYTDLQQQLQNWAERADLSQFVPDIIVLAESWLNVNVPLRVQWVDLSMSCATGSRNPTVFPTDFVEPDSLFLTTFGVRTELKPLVPGAYALGTTNGTPRRWAINGANIELDVPCNQTHTFIFRYRKSFALSGGAPTNYLLTNHPNLYLAASMVELFNLAPEGPDTDKEQAKWLAQRNSIKDEIVEKEARSMAVGQLVCEDDMVLPARFNIITGE